MEQHVYFFSFSYQRWWIFWSMGNTDKVLSAPINSLEQVREVEAQIEREYRAKSVCVLNYKLLCTKTS